MSTGGWSSTVMSVTTWSGLPQSTFTTNVTPWFGSYGGPCRLTFSTAALAAPTNRGLCFGSGALGLYSEADMRTTESWLMGSQLKFKRDRPWRFHQYWRAVCGIGAEPSGWDR